MRIMLFLLIYAALASNLKGQQLSGRVLDNSSGEAVGSATVRIAGKEPVVHADMMGYFRLNCNLADTLIVTATGYKKRMLPIDNLAELIVLLESNSLQIEEVNINTGYYLMSRERAAGSFSLIDNSDLSRNPASNIISRLEGLAPGLQFVNTNGASKEDIRIRGLSTIESDATPLIVLDNFPYEGDINNLDPNDIENISVLKDAAAASIWGARAGNGVIVITTKKGGRDGKMRLNFNQVQLMGEKVTLDYGSSFLPSSAQMEIEKKKYLEGSYSFNNETAIPLYVDLLKQAEQELITADELQIYEQRFLAADIRREAEKYLYRGERNSQYNLGMAGGNDRNSFQASFGYMKAYQSVIGDHNRRLNLNFRNDYRPFNFLDIGLGLAYVEQDATSNGIDIDDLATNTSFPVSSYYRLMGEDGPAAVVSGIRYSYAEQASKNGLLDWLYRPLADRNLSDNRSWSNEIRFGAEVKIKLVGGLSLSTNYQLTRNKNGSSTHYLKDSYYVRDLVNRFTQADGSMVIPYNGILSSGNPGEGISHYGRSQFDYDALWKGAHRLTALAGLEMRHAQNEVFPGSILYNYNDEYLTGSNQYNFSQLYTTRPNGATRYIPSASNRHALGINRDLSYFGNVGYSFRNRYVFNGSLRWDGSNLFGVKANQKGVPLWSSGVSWDVSQESFYRLGGFLPYARLRITYGVAGNVNKTVTHYPTVQYGTSFLGLTDATLLSVGNPSLRWEKVSTFNFGLDFGLFDNVLRGNVDYYMKDGTDLIGDDYMDPTTGVTGNYKINYADIRSKGLDMALVLKKKWHNWGWTSGFNYSLVRNAVQNYRTDDNLELYNFFNAPSPPAKGVSRDAIYAIPWNGLNAETGQPIIYMDGESSQDYNTYYQYYLTKDMLANAGVSVPTHYATWRNAFRYGSFEITAMLSWKAGYVFRRASMGQGDEYSNIYHRDYLKRWEKPGDELFTNVPAAVTMNEVSNYAGARSAYVYSTALIEQGDHLRLKDITLSYTFTEVLLRQLRLRGLSLGLHVNNVGLLWKKNRLGIDPDAVDAWSVSPRTYSLSLNLNL
ncbi:SusC/RagA family TonB-linked outer membrane protein [Sphingobacterium sp. LRF_L2]|uniref:SusC/RagA family TonB-linked outer membrane protein n=1 Tax=Sphingobacterium sp. LRF_L2 TaxID=3369421 RepID=UPI003F62BA3B